MESDENHEASHEPMSLGRTENVILTPTPPKTPISGLEPGSTGAKISLPLDTLTEAPSTPAQQAHRNMPSLASSMSLSDGRSHPKDKRPDHGHLFHEVPRAPVTYEVISRSDMFRRPKRRILDRDAYEGVLPREKTSVLEIFKQVQVDLVGEGEEEQVVEILEERMIIHSEWLIEAIFEAVGYYPSAAWHGASNLMFGHSRTLDLSKPYRMFDPDARRALKAIRERYSFDAEKPDLASTERDKCRTTADHIRHLEAELDRSQGQRVAMELERHSRTPGVATFDMLWVLFRPGTIVFTEIGNETVACRVLLAVWGSADPRATTRVTQVEIVMWYLEFDGSKINRVRHSVTITRFQGERTIVELPAYPVSFHPDKNRWNVLVKRGKEYYKLLKDDSCQVEYRGFVAGDRERKKGEYYFGKAIVDPRFAEKEGAFEPRQSAWLPKTDVTDYNFRNGMEDFVDIVPGKSDSKMTDEHYALMPPLIYGFLLGVRNWGYLEVDKIRPYVPKRSMIKSLVMERKERDTIKAITSSAYSDMTMLNNEQKTFQVDPVKGKGEGKVILLHGNPGTGKTFTAECIAEYMARPLLRISTAELGTNPTTLEQRLWKWFRYAHHWEAILLIDEAEVYMRQRSKGYQYTLDHETIVTIFLRTMEYYRGVLFLTTNQPLHLDWAVQSRVSYVVWYPDLGTEQKRAVREEAVRRITSSNRYDIQTGALKEWKKMDKSECITSGRQIINVLQQTIALAEADAEMGFFHSEEDEADKDTDDSEGKTSKLIKVDSGHALSITESVKRHWLYEKNAQEGKSPDERARDRGDIGQSFGEVNDDDDRDGCR